MTQIKFMAWDGKTMFDVAVLALTDTAWSCEKGRGVSIAWQPHIKLMQFTGAKAVSNNQEVYEGFICTATFKTKDGIKTVQGEIVLDDFMWCLKTNDDCYSLNRLTIIEVLGNIYQNPELINAV